MATWVAWLGMVAILWAAVAGFPQVAAWAPPATVTEPMIPAARGWVASVMTTWETLAVAWSAAAVPVSFMSSNRPSSAQMRGTFTMVYLAATWVPTVAVM